MSRVKSNALYVNRVYEQIYVEKSKIGALNKDFFQKTLCEEHVEVFKILQ